MGTRISNNLGIIIFSRFNSKRLPGKAMKMIKDKPLLGHVISRAKKISKKLKVVVATSKLISDNIIEEYALKHNVEIFRGNHQNVIVRALDCCEEFGFTDFLRICGDRPLFSPDLSRQMINIHQKGNFDLTTNAKLKTFPYGMTIEVIKTTSLIKINKLIRLKTDKEHLTSFYYKNPKSFAIKNILCKINNISNLNFAIDTKRDLLRINKLFTKFKNPMSW